MHYGVTFNFGPAKVYSSAILRHVSLITNILIAATDQYMYFYIIVPFPLTVAILQLINLTDS